MDLTAITLCMERKIPLVVFNLKNAGQHRPRHARREGRDEDHAVKDRVSGFRAYAELVLRCATRLGVGAR